MIAVGSIWLKNKCKGEDKHAGTFTTFFCRASPVYFDCLHAYQIPCSHEISSVKYKMVTPNPVIWYMNINFTILYFYIHFNLHYDYFTIKFAEVTFFFFTLIFQRHLEVKGNDVTDKKAGRINGGESFRTRLLL